MKKTIIVLVVMITAAVLGAQTVWTGNATVGDSADFPGTYGNLRAKSNTFPPGTQLRVSNPKDAGFVDVEIVSPLNVPGVLILIEQAAADAINLPRDHIFPVRVTPTSAAQVGKSFPIIAYNAEKSADPDINPEAMLYGAESFGNYTEALTADPPPEPPVESVVVPSAETAEELTPEPPIESTEEIAAEPPIESAEEIAVPPPEELVVLPPPMPPIETGDEVEDREEFQKESRAASLREFQGEFAEDPVKEYRKEIEGEYAEFFEDDLKEETTLSKTDKTAAPPFEELPEEDSRPAFVAYNPAEDNVSDKAEEGKKSITMAPITEEIEADDSPPFTDDSHLSVSDSLPLTDDKRLRIVEDSPPPTDTPPPVLEGTPPLTDKRLRIVEDSPPLTDAPPPVVEGTPPLTVKDPRMVEDSPPHGYPSPSCGGYSPAHGERPSDGRGQPAHG